jgi:hypothetical protein
MDQLVKEGIELDHAYSYKFCSPTRSCLQSGRLPVHVNVLNIGPEEWNPADPVSGFAAIPRNSASYSRHARPLPTELLRPARAASCTACARTAALSRQATAEYSGGPLLYAVTGMATKLKSAGVSTADRILRARIGGCPSLTASHYRSLAHTCHRCVALLAGWLTVLDTPSGQVGCWCEKRHFLRHLYIKTNILPRQARDKHGKS